MKPNKNRPNKPERLPRCVYFFISIFKGVDNNCSEPAYIFIGIMLPVNHLEHSFLHFKNNVKFFKVFIFWFGIPPLFFLCPGIRYFTFPRYHLLIFLFYILKILMVINNC